MMKSIFGTKSFRQVRNKKEARIIGHTIDCLIEEFGASVPKDSKAVEILISRLAALIIADATVLVGKSQTNFAMMMMTSSTPPRRRESACLLILRESRRRQFRRKSLQKRCARASRAHSS